MERGSHHLLHVEAFGGGGMVKSELSFAVSVTVGSVLRFQVAVWM
jgi:hypothetical protein